MLLEDVLAGDVGDDIDKLINRYHLLRPDIHWPGESGPGQPRRPLKTLINIQKRACLVAIAPHLDFRSALRFRDLAADGRWSLFPATGPGSIRSKNVVVPRDIRLHSIVS